MPNTRSKSRRVSGAVSKYMRYESSEDNKELMVSSMNELKNCLGNTSAQQDARGLYKVEMYIAMYFFCFKH